MHVLIRTPIEKRRNAHTLRDMFPIDEGTLLTSAEDAISETQTLTDAVDGIGKNPRIKTRTKEITRKIQGMDMEAHRKRYLDAYFSASTDRILYGPVRPIFSHERIWKKLYRVPGTALGDLAGVVPIPGQVDETWLTVEYWSGLSWDGLERRADIFTLFMIYTNNLSLFEHLESLEPDAGYCDVHLPDPFTQDFEFLESWEKLREAASRYILYEEKDGKTVAHRSIHMRVNDVFIDAEREPEDPQVISLRKPMFQRSMPPRRVLEKISRDEDLTVVTVRIPIWLRKLLEDGAKKEGEQLGTYLRERLQQEFE